MRNLNIPDLDAVDVYTEIRKNSRNTKNLRKRDRLIKLESYVLSRYSEYEKQKLSLEKISDSKITNKLDKKSLESCYNRNSEGYLEGEVVVKILEIQSAQHKNSCPYCGIDKPRTIDHYLPKSEYPEFSIYPPNLIPCCPRCNSKKSDDWRKNGKRIFINYYFDSLPDEQFLFASLKYEKNNFDKIPLVTFEIKNNGNISKKDFSLIERHFNKLDLLKEYSEYVEEELSNIHDEISHNTHIPKKEHKETLERRAHTFARKYGVNYWKACLYNAVIASEDFFDRIYKSVN